MNTINKKLEKHEERIDIKRRMEGGSVGFTYCSKSRKHKTPWWNERVKEATHLKVKRFRIWMRSRVPESRRLYIQAKNSYNRIKKPEKSKAWGKICDDLENDLQENKKLTDHVANSYRTGTSEKVYNIKDPLPMRFLQYQQILITIEKKMFQKPA